MKKGGNFDLKLDHSFQGRDVMVQGRIYDLFGRGRVSGRRRGGKVPEHTGGRNSIYCH